MTTSLLTPDHLADRWNITTSTLKQWRWNGKGPQFIKLGGRILYDIQDIKDFEKQKTRQSTSHIIQSSSF